MSPKKQEIWAVIPAAGEGARMQSEQPKQYLELNGEPILSIIIKKFLDIERISGVVVAIQEGDTHWPSLDIADHPKVKMVSGGKTRSESVLRALEYLAHLDSYQDENVDMWACVHDAARPCVTTDSVLSLMDYCTRENSGAILAIPVADTVKKVKSDIHCDLNPEVELTLNRNHLWQAQTPQMFLVKELKPALDFCELDGSAVTDEASAIENVHGKINLVMGRRDNIKITVPEDLLLAEYILQQQHH